MQTNASFFSIPASLRPFFQEYDLAQLDLEQSAGTIIERVLMWGSRLEIRWLFETYPEARIAAWVSAWGQDALPEPHLSFWHAVLNLPENP